MKKIILGSFTLILFSSAVLLFQISCRKSADAQTSGNGNNSGVAQLNKIVFTKLNSQTGNEIWLMNYDGTGQAKVTIALPAGTGIGDDARLSPDGKKLFLIVSSSVTGGNKEDIYSCDVDGKNLVKLYDMPRGSGHTNINGAY